ncbi:MAG: sialidase family protein [Candidatus Dormibacteria bacterium]
MTSLVARADGTVDQASFGTQSQAIMQKTASAQMTKDNKNPTRGYGAPGSMLVDPSNPQVIVAATSELRSLTCHLIRSDDAGTTWHILPKAPDPGSYPNCTVSDAGVPEAMIAWGKNNTLYYARAGYDLTANEGIRAGHISILLQRSTDFGVSWTTTVVDNNRQSTSTTPPSDSGVTGLAVDSSGTSDVVYVGYIHRFPTVTSTPANINKLADGEIDVATSTDGGSSFGALVNVNTFSNVSATINGKAYGLIGMNFFGNPFMTAHNGTVLTVMGAQFSVANSPTGNTFLNLPQLLARSTDQGKTWTVSALGPPTFTANGGGAGAMTGMGWTPTGGNQGTFVAAYSFTPSSAAGSGSPRVVEQRSTDGGQTWSDPLSIDDSDPSLKWTSFYPQMGVAPNGRVDVVFESNRDEANDQFDVYYTYSNDGGKTWSKNVKANDNPVNFDFGISYNGDFRNNPGVASANEFAAVGWADTRNANAATQTQDNYASIVQFETINAGNGLWLPILAAVLDGLATAAIVIAIIAIVQRRRRRAPVPTQEQPTAGTK